MIKVTEILQILSDNTRLRLLRLACGEEELSVAELQEILEMGQSRISTHLFKSAGTDCLNDRKGWKENILFSSTKRFPKTRSHSSCVREDLDEEFWESDQAGLNRVIDRRRSESERYFDEVAERLGKTMFPVVHGMRSVIFCFDWFQD